MRVDATAEVPGRAAIVWAPSPMSRHAPVRAAVRADLSPNGCALLVVDLQNDFCHAEAFIGRQLQREQVDRMCSAIVDLRRAARNLQVPVIWVRTAHREATDSAQWRRRLGHQDPHICRDGSWGARFFRLAPDEDDVVIEKHRYSAFHGTELQHVLRALGRTVVVVAGTATNVCVESTVRDACMYDYDAVMVADATCAPTEFEYESAIKNVENYFGSVIESSAVVRAWAPESDELGLHYPATASLDSRDEC